MSFIVQSVIQLPLAAKLRQHIHPGCWCRWRFPTTNPRLSDLGSIPSRRGGEPAAISQSYIVGSVMAACNLICTCSVNPIIHPNPRLNNKYVAIFFRDKVTSQMNAKKVTQTMHILTQFGYYPSSCLLFESRRFGDWVLSSSSGGTYSVGPQYDG
jgi:hypothetical protein